MATSATSDTSPFRAIAFTEHKDPPEWSDVEHKLTYMAYSLETCPTTGKEHFQGFAYARTAMKLTGWKKLFKTAHFEKMRGNFMQNEVYCSKQGKLLEFGVRPAQGQRNDIATMKAKLDAGQKPLEIAYEDINMFSVVGKMHRFAETYAQYIRYREIKDNRDPPQVLVRIGPAGTGKTRFLDDTYGTGMYTTAPDNTGRWFDGCDCDVVLFDDVENGQIPPLSLFKRLTDRYPIQVPIKGGHIWWKPKTVVFTSNQHPHEWWPNLSEFDRQAIERRITDITVVE